MISMQEILKKYKLESLPQEHQTNAGELLRKVNLVRAAYAMAMNPSSGYRSMEDHLEIYREKARKKQKPFIDGIFDESKVPKKSKHLFGQAVDIADPDGKLQKWCLENEKLLREFGLWMEDFAYTKGWVHFQIVPYGSYKEGGSLWFIP